MGALRDELAELLGPEGLRALSEARGGRRARIPRAVPTGHWLETAVGADAAARLSFRYGGCRLYIPRNPPTADRDRCILELRRLGLSAARIASEVGLSDRQVRNVLARGESC